jgi:hypothetical protein
MKFCPVVPEICRGQVHASWKERIRIIIIIIIIKIRNGAKTINYSYSFFPRSMNLFTADLRNYRTEFHETWWSYRYMFLVDPKVFRFVVKGVKAIFLGKHGLEITAMITIVFKLINTKHFFYYLQDQ